MTTLAVVCLIVGALVVTWKLAPPPPPKNFLKEQADKASEAKLTAARAPFMLEAQREVDGIGWSAPKIGPAQTQSAVTSTDATDGGSSSGGCAVLLTRAGDLITPEDIMMARLTKNPRETLAAVARYKLEPRARPILALPEFYTFLADDREPKMCIHRLWECNACQWADGMSMERWRSIRS